mmetsp:Transcript_42793/g.105480  ORF Transcript_42793/g.105480 Transcript_42793/m.105480 type:complete len:321 (+) Transcript_42793:174-1136(+)
MFCRVGQVRTSFYVALPHDGSFSASFEADDGQAIWPLFAQLRFLDELGQCAAAGPELLVFVDLETVKLPAECAGDSNDDFDAGAEGWSHEISSGSRMAVAAEPLPRGGVNTYGVSARRRTSTDGPSQYLDTRCFLTPAAIGAKYLLTAQVRFHNVLDSGEADRSHPPDCFVNGQNCATASLVVERKHREPHSEELLPSVSYDIGAQVAALETVRLSFTGPERLTTVEVDNVRLTRVISGVPPSPPPSALEPTVCPLADGTFREIVGEVWGPRQRGPPDPDGQTPELPSTTRAALTARAPCTAQHRSWTSRAGRQRPAPTP